MQKIISIGIQQFEKLRKNDYFYVDKTNFIKEWWESGDDVTLITRPRRFGKTLNMDMLHCFFSNQYANRNDLFEGLSIWQEEKYRKLQGTYPVIYLSFADVKGTNAKDAIQKMKNIFVDLYLQYEFLEEKLSKREQLRYKQVSYEMSDIAAQDALKNLSALLNIYYGKKPIILLDEYDTPMQEAYVYGYWDKFTIFMRNLCNATFKTNPYLERAIMTGITRVSKESMFSDLNNLNVVTTTSNQYSTCFGFTEDEVFHALDNFELSKEKEKVKQWYDGFVFGETQGIYNPWSITSFLDKKKYQTYWVDTSSNSLVSKLLRIASVQTKKQMETLLQGQAIIVNFDEQIVFNQLEQDESAIWSLLMASGYLKVKNMEYRGEEMEPWYHLSITNLETKTMFFRMFKGWFQSAITPYNDFVKSLLAGNLKEMNLYMNEVALETISSFDSGKNPSKRTQPERFYHGFVLGLLVELRNEYLLKSNRESGYGRYDVMLIPKDKEKDAIIMEFKVFETNEEETLEETVQSALEQIDKKQYDTELLTIGFSKEQIKHYGFAFKGKNVLIGTNKIK